jgi:quinol monooxygenase YgiN
VTRVILKGYVIVADDDLDAINKALPAHIVNTRAEDGCLLFNVTQDVNQKNRFNVHEEFKNKESFLNHQDRVKHSEWGNVSANLEKHYHINQIE